MKLRGMFIHILGDWWSHRVYMKDYILRKTKLAKGGFEDYEEFLKSDHWANIRQAAYEKKQTCAICGEKAEALHHVKYTKMLSNTLMWIIPVCATHHSKIHDYHKDSGKSILVATKKIFGEKSALTKKWFKEYWGTTGLDNFEKVEKRKLSMRIVPSSGLPETLHHSFNSGPHIRDKDVLPEEFLEEWVTRKVKKKDKVMLDIYEEYAEEAWSYLSRALSEKIEEKKETWIIVTKESRYRIDGDIKKRVLDDIEKGIRFIAFEEAVINTSFIMEIKKE